MDRNVPVLTLHGFDQHKGVRAYNIRAVMFSQNILQCNVLTDI